jgi:dipeptidase D
MTSKIDSRLAFKDLQPEPLWRHFYQLTQIPRPSKHEEKVIAYLVKFAEEKKLKYKKDHVGNVLIYVPATSEKYKNSPVVCLQGHVDIVPEKEKDLDHDFLNDPLTIIRDGDWIKAVGTTLGGDDGIGCAMMLSVAEEKAEHGPLELLFTVDEETGMTGAKEISPDFVKAKYLINLDSEESDSIYVGCAGGIDTVAHYDIVREKADDSKKPYVVEINGLQGGHSGCDIHLGRANALKLLGIVLRKLGKLDIDIVTLGGGSKRNAIPRDASATIMIKESQEEEAKKIVEQFEKDAKVEFKMKDDGLRVQFKKSDGKFDKVYAKDFAKRIIQMFTVIPHGVKSMSASMPGVVETSTNFAIVKEEGDKMEIQTSQRSFIDAAKMNMMEEVKAAFELSGGKVTVGDGYPGWIPDVNSKLLKLCKSSFTKVFKSEPKVLAIHAGLECGMLGAKFKGTELISFGSTVQNPHTPAERISISDAQQTYKFLLDLLVTLAEQKE